MNLLWWKAAPCVLRTVIVNMQHDSKTAVRGVLWQQRGPWFTLKEAQLLIAGSPPAAVDGDVVLHLENIAFMQVLP